MSIPAKTRLPLLLCLLASFPAASGSAGLFGPPSWVKKRPVSPKEFIGIGMVKKSEAGPSFAQAARGKALADLSAEISVTVSSEFVDKAVEKSGLSEAEIRSDIRSTTQAELESYDAVDSWENGDEYWVYYRLKKEDYAKARAKRKEERSRLALDLWEKGLAKEKESDVPGALALYAQALSQVQAYLGEGADIQRGGKTIALTNEIYASLQSLLGGLRLVAPSDRLKAVAGRSLGLDLPFTAVRRVAGQDVPVSGLPVSCSFVRGAGALSRGATTDGSGAAACRLARVESPDKLQVVLARPDVARSAGGDPSKLLQQVLRKLTVGTARFELEVAGRPAYLDAKETNMDEAVEVPQLVPALSDSLTNLGFSLVDSEQKADVVLELRAAARKGSDFHGMCIAYLDLSLAARDRSAGTELFKTAVQNVKGMQFDCPKAGLKAFESALIPFNNEVLPALTERLKQ